MFFQQRCDKELPFDAPIPYASCCRKGKRSALSLSLSLLLTFPIFSSLSTLCKITSTSTPMRLHERCKHASNDFTLAAVLSSAIPRLYNSYQRLARHKIAKKKRGGKNMHPPLRKIANAPACSSRHNARLFGFHGVSTIKSLNKFHRWSVLRVTLSVLRNFIFVIKHYTSPICIKRQE